MTQADRIISLLGGVRRTADITGIALTTVQSWRDGGFIPARRMQKVFDAAVAAGVTIAPADFFEPERTPTSFSASAAQVAA